MLWKRKVLPDRRHWLRFSVGSRQLHSHAGYQRSVPNLNVIQHCRETRSEPRNTD